MRDGVVPVYEHLQDVIISVADHAGTADSAESLLSKKLSGQV